MGRSCIQDWPFRLVLASASTHAQSTGRLHVPSDARLSEWLRTSAWTEPSLLCLQLPPQFSDDLFAAMGPKKRPDHRWLILGPARSGSSFHQDPNATSAWNGVIYGSKKWILYPPHITPPGESSLVCPSLAGVRLLWMQCYSSLLCSVQLDCRAQILTSVTVSSASRVEIFVIWESELLETFLYSIEYHFFGSHTRRQSRWTHRHSHSDHT